MLYNCQSRQETSKHSWLVNCKNWSKLNGINSCILGEISLESWNPDSEMVGNAKETLEEGWRSKKCAWGEVLREFNCMVCCY